MSDTTTTEQPAGNASHDEWVEYAVSQGWDREEAEATGRDDLRDSFPKEEKESKKTEEEKTYVIVVKPFKHGEDTLEPGTIVGLTKTETKYLIPSGRVSRLPADPDALDELAASLRDAGVEPTNWQEKIKEAKASEQAKGDERVAQAEAKVKEEAEKAYAKGYDQALDDVRAYGRAVHLDSAAELDEEPAADAGGDSPEPSPAPDPGASARDKVAATRGTQAAKKSAPRKRS